MGREEWFGMEGRAERSGETERREEWDVYKKEGRGNLEVGKDDD